MRTILLCFLCISFLNTSSSFGQELLITPMSTINSELVYVQNGLFGPSYYLKNKLLKANELRALYIDTDLYSSLNQYNKGRKQNLIGNLLGLPASFFLGREIFNAVRSDRDVNSSFLIGATITTLIASLLNSIGIQNMKNSVRPYNDTILLNFRNTPNGIGLVLSI